MVDAIDDGVQQGIMVNGVVTRQGDIQTVAAQKGNYREDGRR